MSEYDSTGNSWSSVLVEAEALTKAMLMESGEVHSDEDWSAFEQYCDHGSLAGLPRTGRERKSLSRTSVMSSFSFDLDNPPPPKRLLLGWLPMRRTAALVAQGGNMKTTMMVYEALTVAKTGKVVVIVSAEDEAEDYASKIFSAIHTPCSAHYGTSQEVLDRIFVEDVSGSGAKLYESNERRDKRSPWVDDLVSSYRGMDVGFVMWETASRLMHGETSDDFSSAISVTDYVAMELDCSCLVVHHTGKGQAREKIVDMYSGRGGSSFGDNTRSYMVATKLDSSEFRPERVPDVPADLLASGEIIEFAHVRNSFGPKIEARYIRASMGVGPSPAMEEYESIDPASEKAVSLRAVNASKAADASVQAVWNFVKQYNSESDTGPHFEYAYADSELFRDMGVKRNQFRSALKTLESQGMIMDASTSPRVCVPVLDPEEQKRLAAAYKDRPS